MKMFKTEDFLNLENPNPEDVYREEVFASKDQANGLGAIFGLLPPGFKGPIHYHKKRESVISILAGKGLEICGEEEIPIQAGDMILIPAGMKHAMVNTSDDALRFIEFYTLPPVQADFHFVD